MSNEIEMYSKMTDPVGAIERLGMMFAKSGLAGCDRVEQGQTLAWICMCERKSPTEILRSYDIVEGKLRKKALAALAEFRGRGGRHTWLRSGDEPAATDDDRKAVLELTPTDGPAVVYSYSMADARAEGLVKEKSRWTKRPGNMLRARCISNAVGMVCPEIYSGDDTQDAAEPAALELAPPPPPPPPPSRITAAPSPSLALPATTRAIDVPTTATPTDEQVEAAMGLAPDTAPKPETAAATVSTPPTPAASTAAPAAEAKPFAAGPAYPSPVGGQLTDQLVVGVEQAIGEHAIAAVAWMRKEGWLQKGQGLASLTEARAKRIIKQRDSFMRAIVGGVNGGVK